MPQEDKYRNNPFQNIGKPFANPGLLLRTYHIYFLRLFDFPQLADLLDPPPDLKRRSLISNKIRSTSPAPIGFFLWAKVVDLTESSAVHALRESSSTSSLQYRGVALAYLIFL